jgi:cysteine synthase
MKIAANITELIGNTPLVKLKFEENETVLLGKCEFMNPSGSVKRSNWKQHDSSSNKVWRDYA